MRPWTRALRAEAPVAPPEVGPEEWVRLLPVGGMEAARLPAPAFARDGAGLPLPSREVYVDRKLAPAFDLTPDLSPAELLCSERLARALAGSGATGWTATVVPHLTPHAVAGRRVFRLACDGWTGPVTADTQLVLGRANPSTEYPRGDDRALNGAPVPPVRFDAAQADGGTVRWSPWLGGPKLYWRALVVRGDVYRALARAIPDLRVGVEHVELRGARVSRDAAAGALVAPPEPEPPPAALDDLLAAIARDAEARGHALSPGAAPAAVDAALRALGLPRADDLARLLARFDGATLFRGALRLHRAGELAAATAAAPSGGYPVPPGCVAFGEGANGGWLWLTDGDGRVHAAGRDGIAYGPGAPLARWLADQNADLAYAQDHDGRLPWTDRMLRG